MLKRLIVLIVIILGSLNLAIADDNAEGFSPQVNSKIVYWYNYFYNQAAIETNGRSILPIDTIMIEPEMYIISIKNIADSNPESSANTYPLPKEHAKKATEGDNESFPSDFEFEYSNVHVFIANDIPIISARLLYTGDTTDLISLGVTIIGGKVSPVPPITPWLTVQFPLLILPEIDALPTVQQISTTMISKNLSISNSELDVSAPSIRADDARDAFNVTGEDVVIGIIDSGIDAYNWDFRNSDGTTRIKYLWDQMDLQNMWPPADFGYGSEFDEATINDAISAQVTLIGHDYKGHGTHVAGIAAGNGQQTTPPYSSERYIGIAPEADLIIVKFNYYNLENIKNGVKYIAKRAKAMGKPWVINISIGPDSQLSSMMYGARDGSSDMAVFLDDFINNPNIATYGHGTIVMASGNNGTIIGNPNQTEFEPRHASGTGTSTVSLDLEASLSLTTDRVSLVILYPNNTTFSVSVVTPFGFSYGPFAEGQHTGLLALPPTTIPETMVCIGSATCVQIANNTWSSPEFEPLAISGHPNDKVIHISIADKYGTYMHDMYAGIFNIGMVQTSGPQNSKWDAFIYHQVPSAYGGYNPKRFLSSSYDNYGTIDDWATSNGVIAVGAYNSKNSWVPRDQILCGSTFSTSGFDISHRSYFTGIGPVRYYNNNDEPKPEIYAPGAWVMSSRARVNQSMADPYAHPDHVCFHDPDTIHYVSVGTSVAAPHGTGTVALLLEKCDTLSFSTIKDLLIRSADIAPFSEPMNYLNAYRALTLVSTLDENWEEKTPTRLPAEFTVSQNFPNPFNPSTEISFAVPDIDGQLQDVKVEVFNILGRKVKILENDKLSSGRYSVTWDGKDDNGKQVASGIYLYRAECGEVTQTKKMTLLK